MTTKQQPRLITFEGIEGAGKGLQVARLSTRLKQDGQKVGVLREPGGTSLGEECRRLVLSTNHQPTAHAELLLMMASRSQIYAEHVRPALAAGEWVIIDRSLDSTAAYQGYGQGMSLTFIEQLHSEILGDTIPALTFLLDLPVSEMAVRLEQRGAASDRIESLDDEFFEKVRAGYLELAHENPRRFHTIDATLSPATIEKLIWDKTISVICGG